jgi:hypothetical protein
MRCSKFAAYRPARPRGRGTRHSRNGTLWNIRPPEAALLRLDVGRSDHLAPLLGFIGDEVAEVGGRARNHRAAQVGKPRLDLGVGERGVDFLVELVDDLGGRFLGCADANPRTRLVAGRISPKAGTSGSASERVAVVTASGRSLPALICSIDAGKLSNASCTWPLSRSITMGAEPR